MEHAECCRADTVLEGVLTNWDWNGGELLRGVGVEISIS
jgi:hypothetical protein